MTFQTKARPLLAAPAPRLYGIKLLNRNGSRRPDYQGLFVVRGVNADHPDARKPWEGGIVEAGALASKMNAYYDDKPDLAARPMAPFYIVAPIWSAPVIVEVL